MRMRTTFFSSAVRSFKVSACPMTKPCRGSYSSDSPVHSVVNCGTGGYGTYQSLLAMKQRTPKNPAKPTVFIYGFNDFHEARNVADPANLRAWVRRSSTGNLTVPYCTLDDQGNLQAQVFASYPSLPLRRYSAIVALVEDSYVAITGQSRVAQKRAVTERLLLQMQRYCRDRQIQLVVLMQHLNDECKQHYTSFFRESPYRLYRRRASGVSGERMDAVRRPSQWQNECLLGGAGKSASSRSAFGLSVAVACIVQTGGR
ncbi:MAG: hypothetical protein KatS3mg105_1597 [Gemmatales bacterium]|nr:MAG: hypothetical protein KatS3mg105_1597 [Gemmatales bacterium]